MQHHTESEQAFLRRWAELRGPKKPKKGEDMARGLKMSIKLPGAQKPSESEAGEQARPSSAGKRLPQSGIQANPELSPEAAAIEIAKAALARQRAEAAASAKQKYRGPSLKRSALAVSQEDEQPPKRQEEGQPWSPSGGAADGSSPQNAPWSPTQPAPWSPTAAPWSPSGAG